jgi:hypothetical protein
MHPGTFWLLCWSIGGLIVMSLIPSKRVDRIFPVIPPLCLLLASCLNGRIGAPRRPDSAAWRSYVWTAVALVFAIFFTGGYATWKVVTGYRDHRDALFFNAMLSGSRNPSLALWGRFTKDEGLLLICKMHYIEPDRAVAEWDAGNLDMLVASTEKARSLMPQLRGAAPTVKSSERKKEQGTGYVLIVR